MADHPTPLYPRHPRQLMRTKWSRVEAQCERRHWEVEGYSPTRATVTLRAALEGSEKLEVPWRELRDRARWEPGWR